MSKLALNVLKFEDVREQIITYLTENNAYAGQFDFRSANLSAHIDAMAYTAMMTNYNISHIANNFFLDSTEIRKNAVSRAKEIGYTPKRPASAKFEGSLIYNGINFNTNNSLTVRPRSPFISNTGNVYYNMDEIVLGYKSPTKLENTKPYLLLEGDFRYFKAIPTGKANYSFTILNKNIDENNFTLYVIPKNVAESDGSAILNEPYNLDSYLNYKWNKVSTFREITSDKIYYLEEDINNEGAVKIVFGNGIFGSVPSTSDIIFVEYFETKGSTANAELLISLPPKTLDGTSTNSYVYYNTDNIGAENNNIFDIGNFDISYQNPYNKSYGGVDLETLEEIKFNAPRFFSSTGRTITKSDFVYMLSTLGDVLSSNVVSGYDMFPDDFSQLGHIYLCVVPKVDITELLYNNSLYMSAKTQESIKILLDNSSIVATTRHFYHPTYLMVEVSPLIELTKIVSAAEGNKIKSQVKDIVTNYFLTNFNKLGVPFRESKISVNIDALDYITSSQFGLKYYFILNNKTVENLIKNINNVMYLPTRTFTELDGSKTVYNFIKTINEVVKESGIDFSILDKVYGYYSGSPTDQETYRIKQKQLNFLSTVLDKDKRTVYTNKLIHSTLNRSLYNEDETTTDIATIVFQTTTDYPIVKPPTSFYDRLGTEIQPDFVFDSINHRYQVYFTSSNTDASNIYVADIYYTKNDDLSKSIIDITINAQQKEDLNSYFGITDNEFVYRNTTFNRIPFNVSLSTQGTFVLSVRHATNVSTVKLLGENNVINYSSGYHDVNTVGSTFTVEPNVPNNNFDTIKLDGNVVGTIERTTAFYAGKFQNYLNNGTALPNEVDYNAGDYFIVNTPFYTDTELYYKGDVLIFNNDVPKLLVKANIKKNISSHDNIVVLNTSNNQGDLFDDAGDVTMYNTFDVSSYTYVIYKSGVFELLDATYSLPPVANNNDCFQIANQGDLGTDTPAGKAPIYPSGSAKINDLYYYDGAAVSTLGTEQIYDGDLILYHNSMWILLNNNNTDLVTAGTDFIFRNGIVGHDISIPLLGSLENRIYKTYFVDASTYIDDVNLSKFINPPTDRTLNIGDYIVNVASNQWLILVIDTFKNVIDITDSTSPLPIIATPADVFTVMGSGNFNTDTRTVTYTAGERIMYIGEMADGINWKKYDDTSLPAINTNQSTIGDMVQIIDAGGNFNGSDVSGTIKVPEYSAGVRLFNQNDRLLCVDDVTNTWVKVNPVNVYNSNAEINYRSDLNNLGFNSDLKIKQTMNGAYTIYCEDMFHDNVIGKLSYDTGKFELAMNVDKKYDNSTVNHSALLSDIFLRENYLQLARQSDTIQLIPSTPRSGAVGDFNTTFNQFIVANINEVTLKV